MANLFLSILRSHIPKWKFILIKFHVARIIVNLIKHATKLLQHQKYLKRIANVVLTNCYLHKAKLLYQ